MPDSRLLHLPVADDTLPREAWPEVGEHCPVARTLSVLSTRSAFLVLREAFYGASRFDEFVERTGVSEPVAAARLRELVEAGLLEKVPYRDPGARTRNGYALTERGADFLPALVALGQWGTRWLPDPEQRIGFAHRGCGETVRARLTCDAGHALDAEAIEIRRRPRPAA